MATAPRQPLDVAGTFTPTVSIADRTGNVVHLARKFSVSHTREQVAPRGY